MNYISLILFFSCLCISGIVGYTVTGNKIYDPNGKQVLLRGVDRPSFEWSLTGEQASSNDYALMRQWGSNVVRIATNQDFWLGSSYAAYQSTIDQQVTWATAAGMGVILDLHWNQGGQQNMADRNSITFWTQVAGKYKNNAWVMFELYNEPHDVSWSQWLNGDATYAGMQEMYTAIRNAGALNTVLVGGLNWAFDLSGVSSGFALTGVNIAYATHPYDYAGKQIADWPAAFGNLASTSPVVMTEFGQYCATNTYVSDLLAYAQSNGIHWTAWAWYVSGCSFPSIIADWNGTPSSGVGVLVKSYLSGSAPSSPSVPSTPAPSGASASAPSGGISAPASAMSVYTDSLASGWQDWSWASSYSLSDGTYVHAGSKSIRFTVQSYGGIYLHYTSSFAVGGYGSVQFYVNGGLAAVSASALSVKLYGTSATAVGNTVNFPASVPASQWSLISIPISSFGLSATTQVTGFVIQANVDASAGNIWIDDISFVPAAGQIN
jgi:aryl-phospho-beta-D-glucosidase BglC (GH1 family)